MYKLTPFLTKNEKDMNTIYNNTVTEKVKVPVYADGVWNGNKIIYSGIRKVGYKVVEFTYDVNPSYPEDKLLLSEREIKRKITA